LLNPENRLLEFINNEKNSSYKNYSINSIQKLLKLLNNPENKFKSIHIAGTNGKGSTAEMLNSVFSFTNYKVGLYTSPHLLKINERIKINNVDISDENLNKYLDKILNLINSNNLNPTFFDILTVIAFLHFAESETDIAIIETGMGGKSDSTNCLNPLLSIITEISKDHTHILGDNLEDIAEEKAGIIKKQTPVIALDNGKIINSVIEKKCFGTNSNLFLMNKDFFIYSEKNLKDNFFYIDNKDNLLSIKLSQPGKFQILNASLVVKAIHEISSIYPQISTKTIKNGLSNFKIKARLELLSNNKKIYFDTAHNLSSTQNLIEFFSKFNEIKKSIILTLMTDKDILAIFSYYIDNGYKIYYYTIDEERVYIPDSETINSYSITLLDNEIEINKIIQDLPSDEVLIFTGSFKMYEIAINQTKNI